MAFQKTRFCSAGGRRARECNRARHIEFSYHIEVRTLNARRMFREKTIFNTINEPHEQYNLLDTIFDYISLNMRLAFRVLTSIWIRILDLTRAVALGPAASPG